MTMTTLYPRALSSLFEQGKRSMNLYRSTSNAVSFPSYSSLKAANLLFSTFRILARSPMLLSKARNRAQISLQHLTNRKKEKLRLGCHLTRPMWATCSFPADAWHFLTQRCWKQTSQSSKTLGKSCWQQHVAHVVNQTALPTASLQFYPSNTLIGRQNLNQMSCKTSTKCTWWCNLGDVQWPTGDSMLVLWNKCPVYPNPFRPLALSFTDGTAFV